jgi:hypothetical protein
MAWADVATASAKPAKVINRSFFTLRAPGKRKNADAGLTVVNNSSHDAEALLALVYWPMPTVRPMRSRHPGLSEWW